MKDTNLPNVRVTEAEKAEIERQAAHCNLSVSEFIRTIGMMDWVACPDCGELTKLHYDEGYSGSETEPAEEGVYRGYCLCGMCFFIPEGEYHA